MDTTASLQSEQSLELIQSFFSRFIDERKHHSADRRSESREHVSAPLALVPLADDFRPTGDPFQAIVRDVSGEGIGLFCRSPVDAEFLGVLLTNGQAEEELLIVFRVWRCMPKGNFYDVGGKFVTIVERYGEDD